MLERWFRLSGCSVFSETDVSQPTENKWKKQPKKNIERTSEGVKLLLKSTLKNYKQVWLLGSKMSSGSRFLHRPIQFMNNHSPDTGAMIKV